MRFIAVSKTTVFLLFPFLCQASTPGAVYNGPYISFFPVVLSYRNDVTISGLQIYNTDGDCIQLINCRNIKIVKCRLGYSAGCGISLVNCENITINDCRIDSVATGVYAVDSHGISVTNITVQNVQGPLPRGQMVQFNNVSGTGNRVNYNICENIADKSKPEDAINMYKTNGTAADPVQVTGNWIRGGGPSLSGGGIMAGDNGGSYIVVKNNILVNPGQYGIAIAGGNNIQILGNIIYSKQQQFTNVGLYIWNQYKTACALNTISGNKINWVNKAGEPADMWDGSNCGKVAGWDDNNLHANITDSILPVNIAR